MDLATLKPSEITLDILHPGNGKKLGIVVSLVSIEDEKMKKLKRFIANESLKTQQRGKTVTAEKLEENENKLMFAAMSGWTWGKDEDGEQASFNGNEHPTFDEPTVYKVFNELPWFREQISKKVGETESFFQT